MPIDPKIITNITLKMKSIFILMKLLIYDIFRSSTLEILILSVRSDNQNQQITKLKEKLFSMVALMTLVSLFVNVDKNVCKTTNSHVQLQLEYYCKEIKYKILSNFLFAHSLSDMRPLEFKLHLSVSFCNLKLHPKTKRLPNLRYLRTKKCRGLEYF